MKGFRFGIKKNRNQKPQRTAILGGEFLVSVNIFMIVQIRRIAILTTSEHNNTRSYHESKQCSTYRKHAIL